MPLPLEGEVPPENVESRALAAGVAYHGGGGYFTREGSEAEAET